MRRDGGGGGGGEEDVTEVKGWGRRREIIEVK
jgi:hypothetical protein